MCSKGGAKFLIANCRPVGTLQFVRYIDASLPNMMHAWRINPPFLRRMRAGAQGGVQAGDHLRDQGDQGINMSIFFFACMRNKCTRMRVHAVSGANDPMFMPFRVPTTQC